MRRAGRRSGRLAETAVRPRHGTGGKQNNWGVDDVRIVPLTDATLLEEEWGPRYRGFMRKRAAERKLIKHVALVCVSKRRVGAPYMRRVREFATHVHRRCATTHDDHTWRSCCCATGRGGYDAPITIHKRLLPIRLCVSGAAFVDKWAVAVADLVR